MGNTFKIKLKHGDEIWKITKSRLSIFHRKNRKLINFWVQADEIETESFCQRSENGINFEILTILPESIYVKEFELKIPYIEIPTLGEMDKYIEYYNTWGEDKDLYYNLYYDEHLDPRDCTIRIKENDGLYAVYLIGKFDDRSHGGLDNTNFEIQTVSMLYKEHEGYWTE